MWCTTLLNRALWHKILANIFVLFKIIIQFIGSRISLISKKNIRYEGTLYSINESDSTVALQDVKSFGTEGRELLDTTGASTFVPPNDVVHAYLLFRGQDIKDLHVHEGAKEADATPAAAAEENQQPAAPAPAPQPAQPKVESTQPSAATAAVEKKKKPEKPPAAPPQKKKQAENKPKPAQTAPAPSQPKVVNYASKVKEGAQQQPSDSKENKPQKKQPQAANKGGGNKNQNLVGTGASLMNKKVRGAKGDQGKLYYWKYVM